MKLSFSISSKPKSASKPANEFDNQTTTSTSTAADNNTQKQFVTEFDPSEPLPDATNKARIIPPIQNEWRPIKRMKNLDLPLQTHDDPSSANIGFEVQTLSSDPSAGDGGDMAYGLNLRQPISGNGESETGSRESQSVEGVLLEKLRKDLKRLPEDPGFEEYEDVPIEGFGAALLKGYGWSEGRGIGRNAKEDVKIKEIVKRTDKQGLGFVSLDSKNLNFNERDKNTNRNRENGDEGRDRANGYADGFDGGKEVRLIAGREDVVGLKGVIMERLDPKRVVLKLARTEETLRVCLSDIAKLGSREEEKCLNKLEELKIRQNNESKPSRERGERSRQGRAQRDRVDSVESIRRERVGREKAEISRQERAVGVRGVAWLRNNIRVRIVSKQLKDGQLYLKKGEVMDVVGPYMCDIKMDESGELVQGVDQDLLETALPRRGGPVLVLYGSHRGAFGNLVEKDLDRETGIVRDSETHESLNLRLEQIAEYNGDPSLIGY